MAVVAVVAIPALERIHPKVLLSPRPWSASRVRRVPPAPPYRRRLPQLLLLGLPRLHQLRRPQHRLVLLLLLLLLLIVLVVLAAALLPHRLPPQLQSAKRLLVL